MQAPRFKWEVNPNTIFQLVQLLALLAAGVWFLGELNAANDENRRSIEQIDKRMTAIETDTRRLDGFEIRITAVEKQAVDAATAMRAVENTLSNLSADIRVVREILQRLESDRGPR